MISEIPLQFCLYSMLSKNIDMFLHGGQNVKKQNNKIIKTIYYKGLFAIVNLARLTGYI